MRSGVQNLNPVSVQFHRPVSKCGTTWKVSGGNTISQPMQDRLGSLTS